MASSGLLQRLAQRFRVGTSNAAAVVVGTDDQALPPPNQTTEQPARKMPGMAGFSQFYDDYRQRLVAYKDYDMIDSNVPELARALSIIAANTTSGSPGEDDAFHVEYAPSFGREDRQIVEDLMLRLALKDRLARVVRNANKYGDVFSELVVDKQGLIVRTKNLDPAMVTRDHDEYDRHLGFTFSGYKQQDQKLEWWRVVHLRHDMEEGGRYGRSLFAGGGRALAYRLLTTRDALAFETANHACSRNIIIMPRPERWSPGDVDDWVDGLTDRFARDYTADENGLVSRRAMAIINGQHTVLDYPVGPDSQGGKPTIVPMQSAPVMDIVKVAEHFQDLMFAVTGVPKSFMGVERGGEGMGGRRLEVQDMQFARQLRREQIDASWYVQELVRRQFILLGRQIQPDDVRIVMPDLRDIDVKARADMMLVKAQAANWARQAGLPDPYIWTEICWDGESHTADEKSEEYGAMAAAPDPAVAPPAGGEDDPNDPKKGTDPKDPKGKVAAPDPDLLPAENFGRIAARAAQMRRALETRRDPILIDNSANGAANGAGRRIPS